MPAAFTIIKITDGTDTVDIDGVNYALQMDAFSPRIPRLRSSELGGRGSYEDVYENMSINILGGSPKSAANLISNIDKLERLINNAIRWRRGYSVLPVRMEFQIQGSALASPPKALLLDGAIEMPNDFNDMLVTFEVEGVKLRQLQRRGQWIGTDTVSTTPSGTNANIVTATFGTSATVACPMKVQLSGFTAAMTSQFQCALLITNNASKLAIVEAETGTTTNFTSVVDGNNCRGSAVMRFTDKVTPVNNNSGKMVLPAAIGAYHKLMWFAMVRTNTSNVDWRMRVRAFTGDSAGNESGEVFTAEVPIGYLATIPQMVPLGMTVSRRSHVSFNLEIHASSNIGNPTIDIDYVAVMAADDNYSRAIVFPFSMLLPVDSYLVIDDKVTTEQRPYVGFTGVTSGNELAIPYQGDPFLETIGNTVSMLFLAHDNTSWRYRSAGSPTTNQLTATRRNAYITPQ